MYKFILLLLTTLKLLCSADLGPQAERNSAFFSMRGSREISAPIESIDENSDLENSFETIVADDYEYDDAILLKADSYPAQSGQLGILAIDNTPPNRTDLSFYNAQRNVVDDNQGFQPDVILENSNTGEFDDPDNQTLFQIFARAPVLGDFTGPQSTTIPTVCIDGEEDRVEFEVAGGLVISSSRFPYMVSIQQQGFDGSFHHFCGGTLLTNKLIMTAAHCVYSGFQGFVFYDYREDGSKINGNIDVGYNIFASRAPKCRHLAGQEGRVRVIKHFLHPSFNGNTIQGGDIAILEVEQPFDYDGPFIKVWPAATNQPYENVNVVAGWGAINEDEIYDVDLFLNSFQELRMGILRWMGLDACKREVAKYDDFLSEFIDDSVLCFQNRGVDGCRADSGGPLLQLGPNFINDIPGNDVQLGIVSWGPDITCTGADGLPGLYTNVTKYASWVQTIVSINSTPPPKCTGNLSVFSEPAGETLLSGYSNFQKTAKECCESCSGLLGCNAWIFCFYTDGCLRADGMPVPNGFCELKQFQGQVQIHNSPQITVWSGYNQHSIA